MWYVIGIAALLILLIGVALVVVVTTLLSRLSEALFYLLARIVDTEKERADSREHPGVPAPRGAR